MRLIRSGLHLAVIMLLLTYSYTLSAQSKRHKRREDDRKSYTPSERIIKEYQIKMPTPAKVNFTDLAKYELAHPVKLKRRFIEQGEDREEKVKPPRRPIPPGASVYHVPGDTGNSKPAPQRDSPVPLGYWNGVMDNNTLIPPDIQGAAGNTYVLETTNQEFKIYTKLGTLVNTLSIVTLFSTTGGSGYFDPHCLYDANDGRYVIGMDGVASDGNSGMFLAVSETNDPTGNWYVYGFDGIINAGDFLDYPLLGYNTNWVVLTVNDFIGGETGNQVEGVVYVMNRADLYSGTLNAVNTFVDNFGFGNSPAETRDATQTTEYIVADANGDQNGNGYVQIGSVTGTVNAPQYNVGTTLGVNKTWAEFEVGATQSGTTNTLEAGDTRIGNVICLNNTLWFSHNVPIPAANPTYYGVDWWQVNPTTPSVVQYGRVSDPNGVIFNYYPSISVNPAGDALLGYCTSSPSTFPSAAYSFHASTDAANTMESTEIYKPGLASYYKTYTGTRNRWGDFTGTTTDPLDNSFWNFSEWANTGNEWATVIAHIGASSSICKAQAAFTHSAISSCSAPFTVNFVNTSTSSNSFLWKFGDGDTSTQLNPSHTYTTYGEFNVRLIATSTGTCGTDSVTLDSLVTVSSAIPCVVIMPTSGTYQTQTGCDGTLYDDGGATGNYSNNTDGVLTISPTGATNVKLHFTQFRMEDDYDYLYIYDGPSTNSLLIAAITGTVIPADITSSGPSITIQQTSDEAVTDSGYAIQWSCVIPTAKPVTAFSATPTSSCTGNIQFNNLTTGASSWLWYFGDGTTSTLQNPLHTYTANGTFTVSLVGINSFGRDSVSKANYITINKPTAPVTTGASGCNAGQYTVSATSSDVINWYTSLTDSVPLFTGNTFTTPAISSTTTYYAEAEVAGPTYEAGPVNSSIGSSSYLTASPWYQIFNVLKPCTLTSVYVYTDMAGDRTFQLLNDTGAVLASTTVNLPNGGSTVTLNFSLAVGNSYQLGVPGSSLIYMLRNSSGAVYPYNDPGGYVSIIGNTAGEVNRWYYFYDWIIQSPPCTSIRTPTTVTIGSTISASISSVTEPTCFGYTNGSATVSSTGGVPAITYKWSNNQTGLTATGLSAGNVSVTVTDSHNCSVSVSENISQPAAVSITPVVTNVSCNGGSNGSISLTVSGGIPGYAYKWGGGATTQTISGLIAGTYNITVTDLAGCTASTSKAVGQPSAISATLTPTNVSCNGGNNGSINVTVTGGTSPYTYNWGNNITTANRSNLVFGTYTVTITDSLSCTATASKTISQPQSISIVPAVTNVSCNGGSNGSIDLTVTGGTGSYTYNWGGGVVAQNRSGLAAGTYSVTVTDGANCNASVSRAISQPLAISATFTVTNVSCNGENNGTLDVSASGGTSPYTYSWGSTITGADRTGLIAGTYSVTITDSASCTALASKAISQPNAIAITPVVTNVSCNGGNNGSISLTVSGGTPGYKFNWGGGVTSQNRTGLIAATYNVTVTDTAGCTASASKTIGQPSAIAATLTPSNVSCNGGNNGAIVTTVSGGTSPYTYNWGNNVTTANRSNLVFGTYTVTITDSLSCTASASKTISQPQPISIVPVVTNISCNGGSNGSIDLTVNGGTSGYTYNWGSNITSQNRTGLPVGTYSVTVTDANNCTASISRAISQPVIISASFTFTNVSCNAGSNGTLDVTASGGTSPYNYSWGSEVTGADRTGLTAGTYTVTITDSASCTASASKSISQPLAISVTPTSTNVSCYGGGNGSINLSVSGGTPGYTYNWGSSITSQNRNTLIAGTYHVTVTDSAGCTDTLSRLISQPSSPLAIVTGKTNATCGLANGQASVTISGGTPGYSYLWNGNQTTSSISGLSAGNYKVTVTDTHSCIDSVTITISTSPTFTTSVGFTNAACYGTSTGSIDVTVTGGTQPIRYMWNNNDTSSSINQLAQGTYHVTITDSVGCSATLSQGIAQPMAIAISFSVHNTICNQDNGSITASATGGSSGYSYLWNTNSQDSSISGLAAGSYYITVTDHNQCQAFDTAMVNYSSSLVTNLVHKDATCYGSADGSASVSPVTGTPPFSYLWSTGATDSVVNNLAATGYYVTVSDGNHCAGIDSFTIGQPAPILIALNITSPACYMDSNASVRASASGGASVYSFAWSTNTTGDSIGGLAAGNYSVSVHDANDCPADSMFNIPATLPLAVSYASNNNACFGDEDGNISLAPSGGTAPYSYKWNTGGIGDALKNLKSGSYFVTVTDSHQCSLIDSFFISQPVQFYIATTATNTPAGTDAGTANVDSLNDGVAPYTFRWNNGDTTQSVSGLAVGTYHVTVTDGSGCEQTGTAVVDLATGLPDLSANIAFILHPNPASTQVILDIPGISKQMNLKIYDMLGQALLGQVVSSDKTTLDISNLAPGIYSVELKQGELKTIRQLIIAR